MRALALLVPVLVAFVACADPNGSSDDDVEGSVASGVSRSCSMSRNTILASVSGVRKTAITRGFTWLDADVPYSQSKSHGGYRTDCSGFVSMCWQAGTPGLTTSTFATNSKFGFLGSYENLLPGDAIDDPGHHIVLFLGWDDAAHKGACVLEQASTASDMQFRVRTTASLKSGGFKPLRPDAFPSDAVTSVDRTGTDDTDAGVDEDVDAGAADPDLPTTCVPLTAAQACNAASINGVQCGALSDGCGGTLSCDKVAGFGCSATETCTKHVCVANPSTTPDASTVTTPDVADETGADSASDIAAQSEGEPGDDGSTTRKSSANVASSGCSAAPGSTTRTEASGIAGLVLAVSAFLRRRRSSR